MCLPELHPVPTQGTERYTEVGSQIPATEAGVSAYTKGRGVTWRWVQIPATEAGTSEGTADGSPMPYSTPGAAHLICRLPTSAYAMPGKWTANLPREQGTAVEKYNTVCCSLHVAAWQPLL